MVGGDSGRATPFLRRHRPSAIPNHQPRRNATYHSREAVQTTEASSLCARVVALVQHIKNNPRLSKRIFAFTSHYELYISNRNPLSHDQEALHIEYKPETDTWEFDYRSLPF